MKVSDFYQELAHYTSPSGLKGIIDSQHLWASHASFLNDPSEVKYFFEHRCKVLIEVAILDGLKSGVLSAEATKGSAPSLIAAELTAVLRSSTTRFNHPYILSLCGMTDAMVRRDGLLSQWRAYGENGGYALIFDAAKLEARLIEEEAAFQYQHLQLANVHYLREGGGGPQPLAEILEAEAAFRAAIQKFLCDPRPASSEDLYSPVTTLCCLCKHGGFQEEHEVRVVAIPTHFSVQDEVSTAPAKKRAKEPRSFLRDGSLIPYVELLSTPANGPKRPLPIARIIVGPHRDAQRRKAALEHMLSALQLGWSVTVSDIPYIG